MIYKYLLLLSFILLLQGMVRLTPAEEKDVFALREWPRFGLEEGLSNNSVTVLFQDNDGFLWIGTEDGLNRYDGYQFQSFRHDPSDESSISGNHIQTIMQDSRGNLWIGTRNSGLNKLDHSTGEFTSYMADPESEKSLPENEVYGLLEDNRGRIWVKTLNYIALFKEDSAGFESYGHYNNVFNVKSASGYPLCQESDTSLLVGTKDGINRFNTRNKQFSRLSCMQAGGFSCHDAVFDIFPYAEQEYLLASSLGVYLLDIGSSVSVEAFPSGSEDSARHRINDVLKLESGEIVVGSNRGMKMHKGISTRNHPLLDTELLESFHVTSLAEDKSGIIWVGTRYDGLFKIDPSLPKFKSFSRKMHEKISAGSDTFKTFNFQTVFQDEEGRIWLGTLGKGIYSYHPESGRVQHYTLDSENYNNDVDAAYDFFYDDSGTLWAGTNSGLYYYLPEAGQFTEFEGDSGYDVKSLLDNNKVYALSEDFDDNLWIGTQFGLYKYDGTHVASYFHDQKDDKGLYSDKINALCLDEEGNLWIGTTAGLNVWDRNRQDIRRVPFNGKNAGTRNVSVLSLALSNEGHILAGTRSGLWVIRDINEEPSLMPGNKRLDNDMIKSVVTDGNDHVWVGTNKGIASISPDGTVHNFDVSDGLPGYVFNENSVFRNRSGSLFFGSTKGLTWFHPDSIHYNLERPPLAFTDIRVIRRGKEADEYWPGRGSIEIRYRPFTNIQVEFSALEFTNPNRNRYKVFLQGYDSEWRPITKHNRISFSNLLPGDYTLKVLASNNDFTWNEEPLELEINIVPPLWMSNYAFAFYFLALIFIVHLLINYRVRHYRKANRELQEKTVNKKQIEAQREVLTRINKSLTDSINYARRIQRAMIPAEISFRRLFPASFVYLRARDIVSGDFFWFLEKDDKIFVTAVDCTGHGVPGAFMSIIGLDLLKNIIEVQGVESPSEILKTMNGELIRTLHKEQPAISSEGNVNDGMDMSLVVIDRKEKTLEFAGAYNGFYLVRDNEIHTYKGDRFPVGYLKDGESPLFTRKKVTLQKDDVVYMFSDGLPDQFGGPDHKKFKYRRFRLLLLNIHKMPFADQKTVIHQQIEDWMSGDNEQVDDMLVLGFKPLD